VRRPGDERGTPGTRVGLLRERPLAPVDPAVGAEIGPVQVVGAAGQRLALEPLLAAVGHAVAVGVGQLPDARRRRHVERAVGPQRPLGEHHPVGEGRPPVEATVAIDVLEPDDAMGPVLELDGDLVVRPRRLGDVEPPLLVEVGDDRPVDQRRAGGELDGEAVGQRERLAVERDRARRGGRASHPDDEAEENDGDRGERPRGCGATHCWEVSAIDRAVHIGGVEAGPGGCLFALRLIQRLLFYSTRPRRSSPKRELQRVCRTGKGKEAPSFAGRLPVTFRARCVEIESRVRGGSLPSLPRSRRWPPCRPCFSTSGACS
jgi:hypothetical protein